MIAKDAEVLYRQLLDHLKDNKLIFVKKIEEPLKIQTSTHGNRVLIYNHDKTIVQEISDDSMVKTIRKTLDLDIMSRTFVDGVMVHYHKPDDDTDYVIIGVTANQLDPHKWPSW